VVHVSARGWRAEEYRISGLGASPGLLTCAFGRLGRGQKPPAAQQSGRCHDRDLCENLATMASCHPELRSGRIILHVLDRRTWEPILWRSVPAKSEDNHLFYSPPATMLSGCAVARITGRSGALTMGPICAHAEARHSQSDDMSLRLLPRQRRSWAGYDISWRGNSTEASKKRR